MTILDPKQNPKGKKAGDPCPCHSRPMEFEPGSFAGDCDICKNPLVYTSGGHGGITHAFEGQKALWIGESKSKLSNGKWPQHNPTLRGKWQC